MKCVEEQTDLGIGGVKWYIKFNAFLFRRISFSFRFGVGRAGGRGVSELV